MGFKHSIDPYVAMLKRSERKAIGYGFLALFLLVLAFLVAGIGSAGAGQFAALVEPVRSTVGLFLLCGSVLSIFAAIWFIGRYLYFVKWPERFE
ncbi:hypothetical protein [Massilia sp. LjRoot122]|uniref:hypothetical protein n=1 Tax=Massilia sp. LjRoot122 TaxID=3342257 RepID=UPI003ECF2CB1